jgi:multiple sugar transport system substrate-binding protein
MSLIAACSMTFALAACTGPTVPVQQVVTAANAYPLTAPPVTVTLFDGFSEGVETDGFNAMVAAFEKIHPNITVDVTPNITDQQIISAIKAGNSQAPDVAVSSASDDLGTYCADNLWVDLSGDLKAAQINVDKVFPAPLVNYTQYQGHQCALPLENDAYGLYYNKAEFASAKISGPPKTLSQLQTDALALTEKNPDGSFKRLGFVPSLNYFEQNLEHMTATFHLKWQNGDNKSELASDPGFTAMLNWQRNLEQAILDKAPRSTTKQLNSFVEQIEAPGEFTAGENPFETGTVAMQMDGEWRNQNIINETPKLKYGTAPFPVQDDDLASYGGGYLSGTMIGIPSTSPHQAADWELIAYLAMNTPTLVAFANALYNVPSTFAALRSTAVTQDSNFQTFVAVSADKSSAPAPSSPDEDNYLSDAQTWEANWEAGGIGAAQLPGQLAALDSQIDSDTAASQ